MKKAFALIVLAAALAGCVAPSTKIRRIHLGMTLDEVRMTMGRPFAVRAAKTYEDGTTSQVWEYVPPVFSSAAFSDRYDKTYWIYFVNDRVVQWGEPGDFSNYDFKHETVRDYVQKKLR